MTTRRATPFALACIAALALTACGGDEEQADEEGFDPSNVATYGYASNGSGGAEGQTQWSWLAASTGWGCRTS